MKALIRSVRVAASLQSGANQQALNILADKLETDLRRMVECPSPREAAVSLRDMTATLARLHAEYVRMQIPLIFALGDEKKPVRK